jgi:pyruvate kinase
MKLTKIIATIGPATWTSDMILWLYRNGVNVIRMNFSHRDYEKMKEVITLVRDLNARGETKLSLLLDNKGPEIRTGKKEQKIQYQQGDLLKIFVKDDALQERDMFCDYPFLLEDLQIWDVLRIDSGLCDVEVVEIHDDYCIAKAKNDALVWSYRHINLPGKKLRLPAITESDKEDLLFAIEQGISILAMSFVRSAQHIQDVRDFWQEHGGKSLVIIAKIENQEGLDNLEEIVKASDGVMVARGDLGIEVPVTMLPYYQEKIMETCHKLWKPVIVATQMIESMMKEAFPTRAEIHDIYQAVQMGADATMLSGETAIGNYPLQAVSFMQQTIESAELHAERHIYNFHDEWHDIADVTYKYLLKSALYLAKNIDAAGIVLFTKSGKWAKFLSAYKSSVAILACTRDRVVAEQLWYYHGIIARVLQDKPLVDFDWIMWQSKKLENPHKKPFVLIGDTDTIVGAYPTIQVISKSKVESN